MRRSVPKFARMVETPSEGGGDDAPDVVEEVDALEVSDDEDPDDDSEVWDKDRALAKIRKSNQEAKAQRERAKAAEEKAAQAGAPQPSQLALRHHQPALPSPQRP